MARLPRYVVPGVTLHLIQRGNNRQVIFADDEDFTYFRDCLVDASRHEGLAIHTPEMLEATGTVELATALSRAPPR